MSILLRLWLRHVNRRLDVLEARFINVHAELFLHARRERDRHVV